MTYLIDTITYLALNCEIEQKIENKKMGSGGPQFYKDSKRI